MLEFVSPGYSRGRSRTTRVQFALQKCCHCLRVVSALDVVHHDSSQLLQPHPEWLQIFVGVRCRLVHVIEELLVGNTRRSGEFMQEIIRVNVVGGRTRMLAI